MGILSGIFKSRDKPQNATSGRVDMQLQSADVVVIALPGTAETAGMFDGERIKKMKANAILVNVGRGFIVNTDELTNAIYSVKI